MQRRDRLCREASPLRFCSCLLAQASCSFWRDNVAVVIRRVGAAAATGSNVLRKRIGQVKDDLLELVSDGVF